MSLTLGLVVFPHVQQLDLTGPYDVFAALPEAQVRLIWKDLEPIRSSSGMWLKPDTTYADCGPLDVICVPGGSGVGPLMEDAETLAFLRAQAPHVRYLTSVCTGALVLGAAGLLRGRRATTHWAFHELLAAFGAIPQQARVVRDGNLFSGGGITAGIDFALTLAAELCGDEVAQAVQLQLEYAPAPPFNVGSPDIAPAELVARARVQAAPLLAQRRAIVERAAAALGI